MSNYKIREYDIKTGETVERDMTAEEIAELQNYEPEFKKNNG
jgi:hypothetical protein